MEEEKHLFAPVHVQTLLLAQNLQLMAPPFPFSFQSRINQSSFPRFDRSDAADERMTDVTSIPVSISDLLLHADAVFISIESPLTLTSCLGMSRQCYCITDTF
jgi:hypothetical protein